MAIQYISNGYTGDPGYLANTDTKIDGAVTVSFAEVLQDETLINPDSEYAAEFRDPEREHYSDVAEAKAHGVTMTQTTVGTYLSMTFTDLREFHDYVSGIMIDLKRAEIAAERANAESNTHRINPLLRMNITASSPEAKQQVLDLLATDTKLQTVPLEIDGEQINTDSPTRIDGSITLTLTEAMQEQTLQNPGSTYAAAFANKLSSLTFADKDEAADHGVKMTEKTVTTHPSITFTDLDELRKYLTDIIVSMKRYEIDRERATPETDVFKLSPVLRLSIAASAEAAKDQVLDVLMNDNSLHAVPMVLDSRIDG